MNHDSIVQFARDSSGRVVAAGTAHRDKAHTCVVCRQRVSLRRRRGHRPCFEHNSLECNGEKVASTAAKYLLKEQVEDELQVHGEIWWFTKCLGVKGSCGDRITHKQIFVVDRWDTVELGFQRGRHCVDVAVISRRRIVFAFQLLDTLSMPVRQRTPTLGVPWLMVSVKDVLAFRPRIPVNSPTPSSRCERCSEKVRMLSNCSSDRRKEEDVKFSAEARRVAGAWNKILEKAKRDSYKRSRWPK